MLYNPHFITQLFSFSLYSPMKSRPHFKKINENKAYRARRKTRKWAKNRTKTRNLGIARVSGSNFKKDGVYQGF